MSLVAASMWIVATVLYHIVDRVIGADDTAWWAVQTSDTITAVAVVRVARVVRLLAAARRAVRGSCWTSASSTWS